MKNNAIWISIAIAVALVILGLGAYIFPEQRAGIFLGMVSTIPSILAAIAAFQAATATSQAVQAAEQANEISRAGQVKKLFLEMHARIASDELSPETRSDPTKENMLVRGSINLFNYGQSVVMLEKLELRSYWLTKDGIKKSKRCELKTVAYALGSGQVARLDFQQTLRIEEEAALTGCGVVAIALGGDQFSSLWELEQDGTNQVKTVERLPDTLPQYAGARASAPNDVETKGTATLSTANRSYQSFA